MGCTGAVHVPSSLITGRRAVRLGSSTDDVELRELADVLARYRSAYLVTVGGGVRGHVVTVDPTLSERAILLAGIGSTSRANLDVEPGEHQVQGVTPGGRARPARR